MHLTCKKLITYFTISNRPIYYLPFPIYNTWYEIGGLIPYK